MQLKTTIRQYCTAITTAKMKKERILNVYKDVEKLDRTYFAVKNVKIVRLPSR